MRIKPPAILSGRPRNPKRPGTESANTSSASANSGSPSARKEQASGLPLLRNVPANVAHSFDADGLLASDESGVPSLYAVLRADLYLEPVIDADADPIRHAVTRIVSLLGDNLHYTLNWNRNSMRPRVIRYHAKHAKHFADAIGVLTGTKYGDKFGRMLVTGEFHQEVDIAIKGPPRLPAGGKETKETDAASPWGVLFQGEIADAPVDDALPAPAVLSWSVPVSLDLRNFAESVTYVASGLLVSWGVAGYGYASWDYASSSALARERRSHLPALYTHANDHMGFDVGLHHGYLQDLQENIRTVNWLTLVGPRLRSRIKGTADDRIEMHRTEAFTLLRASERPHTGGDEGGRAAYAAVDALLRPIRLSGGMEGNALRKACGGYFNSADAEAWLRRFEAGPSR